MESIFKKQDLFLTQMRKDYTAGNIPHSDIFKPYFEWKNGGTLITSAITKDEAIAIMWHTRELLEHFYDMHPDAYKDIPAHNSDDPWQEYTGYGKDKYNVSYLEAIDSEMTSLLAGGLFHE